MWRGGESKWQECLSQFEGWQRKGVESNLIEREGSVCCILCIFDLFVDCDESFLGCRDGVNDVG